MLFGTLAKSAVAAKTNVFKTKASLIGKVGKVALIGLGVTYGAAGVIALWDHNAIKNNKTTLSEMISSKLGNRSASDQAIVDAYKADTLKSINSGSSEGVSDIKSNTSISDTKTSDDDFDFSSSASDDSLEMT